MAKSREEQIKEYGWTALPCDPKQNGTNTSIEEYHNAPKPQLCVDIPLPDSDIVKASMAYVKKELPAYTFNHSMRVFYYGNNAPVHHIPQLAYSRDNIGMAIASQQFPQWQFSPETWLLTCLFHDIGTIDKHTHGTFMSFEFYGAILARDLLRQHKCPEGQADSVAEAIIRHQDPVETGTIHTIGLLVQLATQYDNMGYRAGYVHEDTIKDVVEHYPRKNWSKCFSSKIREECEVKPWCHTTALEETFPHDVQHNKLMEPYDAME